MCFPKTIASSIATLGVFLCLAGPLSGEEGGSGDYAPGTYASLLNITPNVPGLAIGSSFIYYSGSFSGGKALPFGGLLAANINANAFITDISLAYTFRPTILGAHYTCSIAIPYVWADAEATVSLNSRLLPTVIGTPTKTVRDGTNGLADIFIIPAALNWTIGDFQINPQFFMVAPTGEYQKGTLANNGKNHWMFDPVFGLSYFSHKTATEFTLIGGFAISTQDPTTHYRNGDVCHLEATLQQYLPLGKQTLLGVGANGFYYQQVTGDSGPGAVIGPNEGTDIGVGPVLTLIHKAAKYNFSVQVKWLPELYTNNRLSGNWVWVTAGVQF